MQLSAQIFWPTSLGFIALVPHLHELDYTSQGQPLGNTCSLLHGSALESPPLFLWYGGVVTPKSTVNRTGWGSADLRHQHLFVLEAGDPRER